MKLSCVAAAVLILLPTLSWSATDEERAIAISQNIQSRHLPFGTVLDPMYASATSGEIVTYTRCGDSAIWTGHWLAAEAFRYRVTQTSEALDAVRRAVNGIQKLGEITGNTGLLVRCVLAADSPLAAGPRNEEREHGEYSATLDGTRYYWIGDTSRDQYLGVFFGLSVAYEYILDAEVRAAITNLVTRMLDRLIAKNWAIVMPDGSISTVFWLRPDQQLALLQVGRQVNPARFTTAFEDLRDAATGLTALMMLESLDPHGSYFKFNLDAITWYTLLRNQPAGTPGRNDWLGAYRTFRRTVSGHGNPFFNAIDLALEGPEQKRDAETTTLLKDWLARPARDIRVDLRGQVRECGDNRACLPVPVANRVPTDFLWQRSPFQLYGGGAGTIESAGIDFILPYWMLRSLSIRPDLTVVSAADGSQGLAPGSLAALYASGLPAGSGIEIFDSAGVRMNAVVLYSSASQINFVVPAGIAPGRVTIRVTTSDLSSARTAAVEIQPVAPAIFSANGSGSGPAAATAIRPGSAGSATSLSVFQCAGPLICSTQPLELRTGQPVYLSLFGTGVRGHRGAVKATIGGEDVPVEYAGPQGQFQGLDQINIRLEASLRTRGEQEVVLYTDDTRSNAVLIRTR